MIDRLKQVLRVTRDTNALRPSHLALLRDQLFFRERNAAAGRTDRDHIEAAARWLAAAQDAMTDGGNCGRYSLEQGWTSSYPETTGYLVPTLLALADRLQQQEYLDRARRAVDFLLACQLSSGAFPGAEIRENTTKPSPFNTAQIINGLTAWYQRTRDQATLGALQRAADWLLSVQDADGVFRRHTYGDVVTTYTAHLSCWLAELGVVLNQPTYRAAAERHLDWVLSHRDAETGWIDLAGFGSDDHRARKGVTHTIAYTVWGILASGIALKRPDAIEAARQAAERIARQLELSGWLPGELDHRWRGVSDYACLTGNAQMALIWFKLDELSDQCRLTNSAFKALDLVKRAQPMESSNPGIRGGIPGSDPVWGAYLRNAIPNWAAKFFVDAMFAKEDAVQRISRSGRRPPAALPPHPALPPSTPSGAGPLKVVLVTRGDCGRVQAFLSGWARWGFKPAAVVVEQPTEPGLWTRLAGKIRAQGLGGVFGAAMNRMNHASPPASTPAAAVLPLPRFLEQLGVQLVEVESLESEAGLAKVKALGADLAVAAGTGILRPAFLALPRLGSLNVHMAFLPGYRGMNVAEWSALEGAAAGCTVHLVDPGVDLGPILAARGVDADGAASIQALRDRVDQAQVELLGETVCWIVEAGRLPPQVRQTPVEGRQYFRLHPDLAAILNRFLAGSSGLSL